MAHLYQLRRRVGVQVVQQHLDGRVNPALSCCAAAAYTSTCTHEGCGGIDESMAAEMLVLRAMAARRGSASRSSWARGMGGGGVPRLDGEMWVRTHPLSFLPWCDFKP